MISHRLVAPAGALNDLGLLSQVHPKTHGFFLELDRADVVHVFMGEQKRLACYVQYNYVERPTKVSKYSAMRLGGWI